MSTSRSTKIETEKRVFTIQGWIISGVPDYLILKNIEKSDWNVGRRQAKNLLQKAYKIWHEDQEASIEQKRSMRIAELKQDVMNMKDEFKNTPKGMSVILAHKKEISKLEALYPATKHIIQGDPDNPVVITDDTEREKRIAELLSKMPKTMKEKFLNNK